MKTRNPLFAQTRPLARALGFVGIAIIVTLAFLYAMYGEFPLLRHKSRPLSVGVTGVHHMGDRFTVGDFSINGYSSGNIDNGGGGGGIICCVLLPESWREGLVADIRWAVGDWSHKNEKEMEAGNYRSITWAYFRALVPVEKYVGEPEHLYVHFFSGGRVRVVSSVVGSESTDHPIKRNDPAAMKPATIGQVTAGYFSSPERSGLLDKNRNEKQKN